MIATPRALEVAMSEKPSYLGLLNAIAVAEADAHAYLTAWIAATTDPAVRTVLSTVAAREGEHGMSFAKRIDELGYTVRRKENPDFERRLAFAASDRSDLEKMDELGFGRLDTGAEPDVFDTMFTDHSIDITTGALLGRYIAEERDSARLLSGCYAALRECAGVPRASAAGGAPVPDRLEALEAKLDAVCAAIERLETTMTTAEDPTATRNGRGRPVAPARSSTKG